MHEDSVAAAFAMLIPIVAIIMGIGIAMLTIYLGFRQKTETLKHNHAERMAAIEKGIELPPLPAARSVSPGVRRPPYVANRNGGLILLFLGAAVTLALWETTRDAVWWGLVIVALGVALLVVACFEALEYRTTLRGHAGGPESADQK